MADQPGQQGPQAAFIQQAAKGEQFPEQAVQQGELDDEAHPAGGVLAVKHQAHLGPLPFHLNQPRNLLQA